MEIETPWWPYLLYASKGVDVRPGLNNIENNKQGAS